MQSIGSLAGFCQIHQMDKMFVNDEVRCIKCHAAGEKKIGRVQTVEDPGEAFFNKDAKATTPTFTHGANSDLNGPVVPVVKGNSLESHISHAISWLTSAPMPKDLKQFKSLQKSITILQSLLENTNG